MPTLEEMLENELGLPGESQEKVASQKKTPETDEIEKIATDLGLFGDSNDNNLSANQQEDGHSKEARMKGGDLTSLFNQCFPDDNLFDGQEKQASLNKEAEETERLMGEYAHDCFVSHLDSYIDKMAADLSGGASVDGTPGDPHPQGMENNYEGKNDGKGEAMNTDPDNSEGEAAMGTSPEGAVGNFEKKDSPNGEMKTAALKKHFLLAQLED